MPPDPYPLEPELNDLLEQARADAEAVGLVLIGSYAVGRPDADSDLDVLYVRRGSEDGPRERRGRVDLIPTTLQRLRSPPGWFKPALAHARVVYDPTGAVAEAVAAARIVPREEAAELYDSYLNDLYRSLKAWRRGSELAARVECATSLRYLGEFLFALGGVRGPYPKDWAGRLGELEPLVLEVARTGDPGSQQELCRRVERLATASGFRDVYDGWDGEIDRVLAFRFD